MRMPIRIIFVAAVAAIAVTCRFLLVDLPTSYHISAARRRAHGR
jgi:hypothetical protein